MNQQQPPNLPYQPPDFSRYRAAVDALAPARRAALFMTLLAALAGLFGVMIIASARYVPLEETLNMPEMQYALRQRPPGLSDEQLVRLWRVMMTVAGIIGLIMGAGLYVLSLFVRRGGIGASITSIVLTALVLIWLTINLVAVLTAGMIAGVVFVAVPAYIASQQLRWLIVATKVASQLQAMRRWGQYAQHGPTGPGPPLPVAGGAQPARIPSAQGPSMSASAPAAHLIQPAPAPLAAQPQPGYYHWTYLQPPLPPGYDQPGSGPSGYGYAQAPPQMPSAEGGSNLQSTGPVQPLAPPEAPRIE